MKKIYILILVVILLTACGRTSVQQAIPTPVPTVEPIAEPTATPVVEKISEFEKYFFVISEWDDACTITDIERGYEISCEIKSGESTLWILWEESYIGRTNFLYYATEGEFVTEFYPWLKELAQFYELEWVQEDKYLPETIYSVDSDRVVK
jgi:hypothetical protein